MAQAKRMAATESMPTETSGSAEAPATRPADPLRLTVLGATGSIGDSTLDLVATHPERFEVVALTAQCNVLKLAERAIRHRARLAVIGDEARYAELVEKQVIY